MATPRNVRPSATDALLQSAYAAYVAGRREEAESLLRQVLAADPANTAAWNNLANLLAESGIIAEAEAAFRKGIALSPGFADLHFNFGNLLKGAGRPLEAEASYREAIKCRPKHAPTLAHLAQVLAETGRTAEAETLFRQAIKLDPGFALAHNNLGILLKAGNRLTEAEAAYRRALTLDPRFAEAHNNLGILLLGDERLSDAEAAFRRAVELKPDFADAYGNLGNLLKKAEQFAEAEAAYRRALEFRPGFVDAHNNLGLLLKEAERLPEAETAFRRAIELAPEFADAYNNLGILLHEDQRLSEAEAAFQRALELKPDLADAHCNLGNLLKQLRRFPESEAAYRRALELKPDDAGYYNNLAILLSEVQRLPEAEKAFRRAIELKPDFSGAHTNLGNLLKELGHLAEAEVAYRRALEMKKDFTDAKLNLGILLLTLGQYAEGWTMYDAGHLPDTKARRAIRPPFAFPQWQGEPLAGKSLVVVIEQGAGDNFQFVRYAPLLKAMGLTRLTYFQPSAFIPLLATAHGMDFISPDAASVEPHDYWSFPLSLPCHLGTTLDSIPDQLPYLWALPERIEKWRSRLPATGFKVGLVWKGNPDHQNDANRSLPHLSTLAPLWDVPGISFVSLQKGQGEDEAERPPLGQPLVHLGSDITDFADTAAIIAQLDLLITVDSAAAHVAGALGKPVWVLLPSFGTDWRWLLEREDSPWYPEVMRLFRQPRDASSWEGTIARLAAALRDRGEIGGSEIPVASSRASISAMPVVAPAPSPAEAPDDAFAAALAAYQSGRLDEAEAILRAVLAQTPTDASCWNNLGNLLQETSRLEEAEAAFRRAIELVPDHPDFFSNLGNLLKLARRLPEAEVAYRQALELQPENPGTHSLLGGLLKEDQRLAEAAAAYRRALELKPDFADAYNNLGIVLKDAGDLPEAEAAYRRALDLKPDFAEAHNNLGILLLDDERFPEGEAAFRRSLELKPDVADVHSNLGNLLKQVKQLSGAEAAYRRAIELKPTDATAYNNLGVLLHEDQRLHEAEDAYRHALELNPDSADAHSNLGILSQRLGHLAAAEAGYRRAIELKPDYTDAKLNLGLLLLGLGRYAEAWPWHEARHFPDNKARRAMQPPLNFPQWQGEPLAGKSLVVVLEQGAGDNVQFVRYAPLLKAAGATRVTFIEPAALIGLLGTSSGVDVITDEPASLPLHDYWSFPLSLPLHLGTTLENIPDRLPYLFALPERIEKWRSRLPATGLKVGLVWKGNPDHKNDAKRSLPHLSTLAPLWDVPGISFVSLQKGQGENEAERPPPGQPLVHLGKDIADFADTAAIIAQLDLVITVDSAAAHVAGALGKAVWVLLPGAGTDWRWLLERDDSPWYPKVMRLFRQPRDAESWEGTIHLVAAALRTLRAAPPALALLSPAAAAPRVAGGDTELQEAREAYLAGRRDEAESILRQLLAADRGNSVAWNNLAGLLAESGRTAEAEAAYREAIALNGGFQDFRMNFAGFLRKQRRPDEAETEYRTAIALRPDDVNSHNNLGIVLLIDAGRAVEAEEVFRSTLVLDPGFAMGWNNLGHALEAQARYAEAEAAYRKALESDSGCFDARSNLGLLLLKLGRYAEAWPWREARYSAASEAGRTMLPSLAFPQWQGEALTGKSLAVLSEEGYGDNIQFARYASLLKALGATRVTFVLSTPLISLQSTAIGVDAVSPDAASLPPHDFWCFCMSIPLHAGTVVDSIPNSLPYLWALPDRIETWRSRLPATGFKVGLVWKGNPHHKNDTKRSLPDLSTLAPLWDVSGISFVSLQKGQGEDEAERALPGQPLVHLGRDIVDFADTAAIVAQLDLLITIDSAAAHVAGALGKPVWVLLPGFRSDWRWLLEREDSPWYPKVMRLFRQPRGATSWEDTIRRVATALRAWSMAPRLPSYLPLFAGVLPPVTLAPPPAAPAAETRGVDMLLQEAHQAYVAGRRDEAESRLREVLARDPANTAAWNNLANLLNESGNAADAEVAYRRAIAVDPGFAAVQVNFAHFLKNSGRAGEAEGAFRAAIALHPDDVNSLTYLGILLVEAGRDAEAEAIFRTALEFDPGFADNWNNLGNTLRNQRRPVDAEAAYRKALAMRPDDHQLLNNLAVVLGDSQREPEAEALLRRITMLAPYYGDAWNNLGIAMQKAGRFAEAEGAYRKVIALNPGIAAPRGNLANLLDGQGRLAEAEAEYRRALALDPGAFNISWNFALLLLNQARWTEAWPYFDRRNDPHRPKRNNTFGCPEWRGENLAGKSLLIDSVEGQGDNIMCARYVAWLKEAGASRITLLHRTALKPLLETVKGVDLLISEPNPEQRYDFWTFSFSLLIRFGTTPETIPARLPYVFPLESRLTYWRRRLASVAGFRVGLVWKGDAVNDIDVHRSLSHLSVLAPLWNVPGVSFVSLQKGQGEDEAQPPPAGQGLLHLGEDIADFADTAAIIAQLDLLITVDTAAAHVAGALGKPVWVLLPGTGTDWRWLTGRTDSPWYPDVMRLFRQLRQTSSWDATVSDVASALAARVRGEVDDEATRRTAPQVVAPSRPAQTELRPIQMEPTMNRPAHRPAAFILTSSDHGTLIVNRNDYAVQGHAVIGVGSQILSNSSFDRDEVDLALRMLEFRRRLFGDGVFALDCGANIGVHTVEWAKQMHGWGSVTAVEAQERVYYALCGNIAINNCFNARAIWGAVGAENGEITVPQPDYLQPGSYGSLEIRPDGRNEFIGQPIDYSEKAGQRTRLFTIDSLALPRVDFIKIDIEGMEMEALAGATNTIRRFRPQMIIEKIKSDETALRTWLLAEGYRLAPFTVNLIAIHSSDPSHEQLLT